MGVYIKGITVDELKRTCHLNINIWNDLVEVPEPHGRLIDASEICEFNIYDEEYDEYTKIDISVDEALADWGCDGPKTVIEAEGE